MSINTVYKISEPDNTNRMSWISIY